MPLLTRAEVTSYQETSLHAHVMAFVTGLAARSDPRLAVSSFGTSPGGRDMPLCVLSAHGVRAPEESRRRGLPTDCHATKGSAPRSGMPSDVPHGGAPGRAEPIAYMRNQMMPAVTAELARHHQLLAGWYGNFVEDERSLDAARDADPAA